MAGVSFTGVSNYANTTAGMASGVAGATAVGVYGVAGAGTGSQGGGPPVDLPLAYRLLISLWTDADVPGTVGATRVATLRLTAGGVDVLPQYTGEPLPAGVTVSASSEGGAFPPRFAFDTITSDASRWLSSNSGPQWVQIVLADPVASLPDTLWLAPDSAAPSYRIVAFTLYSSTTGAFTGEEVEVLTVSDTGTGWTGLTERAFAL